MIKQRKLNNSQIFIPNLHPLKIPDLFTGGQFSATWQGAPSWCYLRLHRVWLVSQPPHLWEGEFSWNLPWLPFGSCFFSSIERQVIQIYGESCFISENISIPPKKRRENAFTTFHLGETLPSKPLQSLLLNVTTKTYKSLAPSKFSKSIARYVVTSSEELMDFKHTQMKTW